MNSNNKISKIAGTLIILGIISGILSIVSSVESDNFLNEVYPNKNRVLFGGIFQFLLVPIYIGFSLVLYPVMKKYHKALSIGFVGFRIMAGVFQLLGIILLPIFILLSQKFLAQTNTDLIFYETIGEILKLFRDLINHLGVILATGLGNLLLYYILFKGKLIPVWLSIWGIIGNTLIMIASFFLLFEFIKVVSTEYGIMTIPLVLQEVVLAIWLILKGLKLSPTQIVNT
ncbi:MAG: hypothetical protein CL840_01770 [Crocinitomicaceae bacterium]|nr:hypothetical protein [Crocinitomicaceae bacterium]|tara:strand:- start:8839 stop:9525 length:687 start_codon:yes stop_codon:yes gene_type:complete